MPIMHSPPGARTVIDGRRYLYFAGTGYLGLQGHPEVIRAACEATVRYGIGSANSRTAFGNTPPVLEVERRAAEFFGVEDAFYFVSGYVGNNILVLALEDRFDALFVDELSHYCVLEAARLTGRPVFRFRHCDAEDLHSNLKTNLKPTQRPLLMSDGVFAARGQIAPLAEYRAVLGGYPGALMCIDDAHALGVLGAGGRGTFEHFGLFDEAVNADIAVRDASHRGRDASHRDIAVRDASHRDTAVRDASHRGPGLFVCGTLSKALGGFGGIIPGSRRSIERLKSTSPYYGGASAPPVPAAAATARALELARDDTDMRTRLWRNVDMLKSGLREMGLPVDDTPVPIICLTIGNAENMQRIQRELMQRGIVIAYMATYSGLGPKGALRLAVFSTHTEEMIGRLLDELTRTIEKAGSPKRSGLTCSDSAPH